MATRTGWSGTVAANDVITAANLNKLPGGIIAYALLTSNSSNITSTTGLASVTITAPGSRLYKIEGGIGLFTQDVGTGIVKVRLFGGATGTTALKTIFNSSMGNGERNACYGATLDTPSAGSVTYAIAIETSANNVDVSAGAAGDPGPVEIIVSDCGPAF